LDKLASGYGITTTGYNKRDFNSIVGYMSTSLKSSDKFGANVDFTDKDPLYHLSVPIMELLAEIWEVAEQTFYIPNPKYAEGTPLGYAGKYIGISRKQATKASGVVRFTGTSGTIISTDFQVKTDMDILFITTENKIIPSIGYVDINIVAVNAGANGNVSSNTITKIVSPLIGLNSVTNLNETTGGQDEESDTNFRTRYANSTSSGSGSTTDAIRANVLKVTAVTDCIVKQNKTDSTVDGIPPHSIYVLVNGGDNTAIAQAILEKSPGGIDTYGSITVDVVDSQGITQHISFSRPSQVDIWIRVDVTTNSSFPADGDTQIQNEVLSYIGGIGVGESVKIYKINAAITSLNLNGIDDMTITLSTDGVTYEPNNIVMDSDKIAITELAKIEVV